MKNIKKKIALILITMYMFNLMPSFEVLAAGNRGNGSGPGVVIADQVDHVDIRLDNAMITVTRTTIDSNGQVVDTNTEQINATVTKANAVTVHFNNGQDPETHTGFQYRSDDGGEWHTKITETKFANVEKLVFDVDLEDEYGNKYYNTALIIEGNQNIDAQNKCPNKSGMDFIITTSDNVIIKLPPTVVATGKVIVKYQDTEGNELAASRIDAEGEVGTAYNTKEEGENPTIIEKDGKKYELVSVKGTEQGTIIKGETEVIYVYDEVAKGSVVVKYQDSKGNEIKATRIDAEGYVGTEYNTNEEGENPTIIEKDGKKYELVSVKGTEQGTITKGETEVIYVYDEVATGTVIVKYQDTKGNDLINSRIDAKGYVGTVYNTDEENENPNIIEVNDNKYELANVIGEKQGTITEGNTEVIYVYNEVAKGSIVVKYQDSEGNDLIDSRIDIEGYVGTEYNTDEEGENPTIIEVNDNKYELANVIGEKQGTITEGNTEVIYVYEEVEVPSTKLEDKVLGVSKENNSENEKIDNTQEDNDNTNESLPNTGAVVTTGIKLAFAISSIAVGASLFKKKKDN